MFDLDDIQLEPWQIAGLDARVASVGQGPVALLVHGWPECWYSWRQQMLALANAGYRAIAPDMPGFGQTAGWPQVSDYHMDNTCAFLLDLIAQCGVESVLLIGHDWGAINVWGFTLRHPERVSRLVAMSVPLKPLAEQPPMQQLRALFKDQFFYQLYFQRPGVAEAEFDADPEGILRALFCSPDTPREAPVLGKSIALGGGWIDRLGKPLEQPTWLSDEALAYYLDSYRHSGFAGGLHYYRNMDHNWRLNRPYAQTRIECPVLFLAGSEDYATQRASAEALLALMGERVPYLSIRVFPGVGHWLQAEARAQVNTALLEFIAG